MTERRGATATRNEAKKTRASCPSLTRFRATGAYLNRRSSDHTLLVQSRRRCCGNRNAAAPPMASACRPWGDSDHARGGDGGIRQGLAAGVLGLERGLPDAVSVVVTQAC